MFDVMRLSQYSTNDSEKQLDSILANYVVTVTIGLARTSPNNGFNSASRIWEEMPGSRSFDQPVTEITKPQIDVHGELSCMGDHRSFLTNVQMSESNISISPSFADE